MRSLLNLLSKPDPDGADMRALQKGDQPAFDRLMERHEEGIFRFFTNSVNDQEDARELAQEVFVRAYFARAQFDSKGTVKSWLYRIAVNLLKDRIKSKAHRDSAITSSLDADILVENQDEAGRAVLPLMHMRTPVDAAMGAETVLMVRAAIATLSSELRPSFVLAVLQEKSLQECASILGLTPKAVEMRVYKARKLLQEELRSKMGV